MSDELQAVLRQPCSVAARKALAAYWIEAGDPRGELVDKQVAKFEGLPIPTGDEVRRRINTLLRQHGNEWAGPLASLVEGFTYELGLVATIGISGDKFVTRAAELVQMAPVVNLDLTEPVNLVQVAKIPALAQMRTLVVRSKSALSDDSIDSFAASPLIRNLRTIDFSGGNIARRGLEAILAYGNLPNLVYIDLTDNPCVQNGSLTTQMFAKSTEVRTSWVPALGLTWRKLTTQWCKGTTGA